MLVILLAAVVGFITAQDVQEIAFSAGLDHDLSLTSADRIVFNTVLSNVGGGYDPKTGTFNCPETGIYVFQFHTLAHQDKAAWLELYHNQQYIASVYGKTTNDYAMAGNSVILQVTKGDQVYIRAVDASYGIATDLYNKPDEIYSTFSGYLITAIATETPVGAGK